MSRQATPASPTRHRRVGAVAPPAESNFLSVIYIHGATANGLNPGANRTINIPCSGR